MIQSCLSKGISYPSQPLKWARGEKYLAFPPKLFNLGSEPSSLCSDSQLSTSCQADSLLALWILMTWSISSGDRVFSSNSQPFLRSALKNICWLGYVQVSSVPAFGIEDFWRSIGKGKGWLGAGVCFGSKGIMLRGSSATDELDEGLGEASWMGHSDACTVIWAPILSSTRLSLVEVNQAIKAWS